MNRKARPGQARPGPDASCESPARSMGKGSTRGGEGVRVRMALAGVAGGGLGGYLGYLAGVYLACLALKMGNLCGLVGVFVTGPIGSVGGGLAGWRLSRR